MVHLKVVLSAYHFLHGLWLWKQNWHQSLDFTSKIFHFVSDNTFFFFFPNFVGHCVRGLLFPVIQIKNMENKNIKLSDFKNAIKDFTFSSDSRITAEHAHLSRSLKHGWYVLVVQEQIIKQHIRITELPEYSVKNEGQNW